MPVLPGEVRVRRYPVTEGMVRLGWLTVIVYPYDPAKLPRIRISLEPPLEDPHPPAGAA